ncbi:MAG: helix-turn-helix domain-containing protein [Candidatus Limnocylindrales bacterium]
MTRFARIQSPPTDWLSLGEASRLLGVSPGTLRRWSDGGRVSNFTTPGGHRRFRRSALERMLPADRMPRLRMRSVVSASRMAKVYQAEARTAARERSWLSTLDEGRRRRFRDQGRTLVQELLAHLDATDSLTSARHLAAASRIAAAYGQTASAMGAPLSEALEAFLQFRRPFLDELESVIRQRDVDPETATELTHAAGRAMDRLLVAAMAAHSVQTVTTVRPPSAPRTRNVGPVAEHEPDVQP